MPSLAWRRTQFARPSRVATPNSRAGAHAKEAQKVTPWKNYLAETTRLIGFFARPRVSPCHGGRSALRQPLDKNKHMVKAQSIVPVLEKAETFRQPIFAIGQTGGFSC